MGRFTKSLDECRSELDYLIYWFKYGWRYTKSLPQEIEKSTELKELVRESEIAAFNKDKRAIYDLSLMNERDILTEKKYAKEEGREEGRKEGREEGAKEENLRIALNFKKAGVDFATISQATGLTIEQVQNL